MKVFTERALIRSTPGRWASQYSGVDVKFHADKLEITRQLAALDTETASAELVNAIIGNSSWTTLRCDECNKYVKAAIEVGEPPDYESATAMLCLPCITKAAQLLATDTDVQRSAVE